jgi:RNA polymerase sigma-54 factor
MELAAKQAPKAVQQQVPRHVLSAQTRLSLKLLNLPWAELSSYIEGQAEENPLLELPDTPIGEPPGTAFPDFSESVYHIELNEDIYIQETTFSDHLLQQVRELELSTGEERGCRSLISQLDERGYLSPDNALSAEEERALPILQSLSPAGVGARSLSECLRLQLERTGSATPSLLAMVDHHLEEIARGECRKIAQALGMAPAEVQKDIAAIRSLSPIPSRGYRITTEPEIIEPEAYVTQDSSQRLVCQVRRSGLRWNDTCLDLACHAPDAETERYFADRKTEAQALMDMVAFRESTMEQIVRIIVAAQHDALLYGMARLKPLTMVQVADKLGVSPSTVSRAAQGKWIQAPCGLVRVRDYFTGSIAKEAEDGPEEHQELSAKSIQHQIATIIEREDPKSPLSDQMILRELKNQGISISRRAVAKYRDEMGIPSSKVRVRQSNTPVIAPPE